MPIIHYCIRPSPEGSPPWCSTLVHHPWSNRFQRGAYPGLHPSTRRDISEGYKHVVNKRLERKQWPTMLYRACHHLLSGHVHIYLSRGVGSQGGVVVSRGEPGWNSPSYFRVELEQLVKIACSEGSPGLEPRVEHQGGAPLWTGSKYNPKEEFELWVRTGVFRANLVKSYTSNHQKLHGDNISSRR